MESPFYNLNRRNESKPELTCTNSAAVMGLGEPCAVCLQHPSLRRTLLYPQLYSSDRQLSLSALGQILTNLPNEQNRRQLVQLLYP